jgi:hypothetical protein
LVLGSLRSASDDQLISIAAHFNFHPLQYLGPDEGAAAGAEVGPWRTDGVRVFLSHLAFHQAFAAQVAAELLDWGIEGFVAHTSIDVEASWQQVIESALRTADVLVGLVHPGFTASIWCQQEVGWAAGRNIPAWFVRFGEDPKGFHAQWQWPSLLGHTPAQVALQISELAGGRPELAARQVAGLVESLKEARSFDHAGSLARAIAARLPLSPVHIDGVSEAFRANDQVSRSNSARPSLHLIFEDSGVAPPWT